ncbi:LLM class flavin-dependent oxidoreductase [Halalkalibacter alkaliphilus]|uniref:LLM class flavin-dependent oxidoreductase n=1 Tax=Halalkalibacter alkaliphilus TaxID=2917993 RepID=A0A9X2I7F7_9BACI|nr:LLM class flavin-dependent oxidoreductase [Halalkalibacter alkaliphilus]MCL7749452.1 LLM class flavin-dependent oxidoreductase [Halalkalibacter alkaliphilus]
MKLSILDQAPISETQTAGMALKQSMELAKAGESLGYTRYWIAEHHDLPGLACSAPEVLLGYIGANTETIRIGCGAVLLPHYKPYKVAEVYNTLATLFPGRIDLGIGRAPGGSAEVTSALSDNFLQQVFQMPTSVKELLHFLDQDFLPEHKYANVRAAPVPTISPKPWLLGTSKKSAILAAEYGMAYAFGLFMSDNDGRMIIDTYRDHFKPKKVGDRAEIILTVSIICAETIEKAEEIALSSLVWKIQTEKGEGKEGVPSINAAKEYSLTEQDRQSIAKMKKNMIIGDPGQVREQIMGLREKYVFDELMIISITHDHEDRVNSYRLLAKEMRI